MVNEEIKCKQQIASLESQNAPSVADSQGKTDTLDLAPVMFMCTICGFDLVLLICIHNRLFHCLQYYAEILKQLNEKAFQLEVWKLLFSVCILLEVSYMLLVASRRSTFLFYLFLIRMQTVFLHILKLY